MVFDKIKERHTKTTPTLAVESPNIEVSNSNVVTTISNKTINLLK